MSKTILLADDSVTIQKVVELTFMDEDFDVVAVSNGTQALARLDDLTPALVIADVHMPGAGGLEVCRQSKIMRPHVPVMLLVGTFEPFDAAEAAAAGADGHLKKPFDSQELLRLAKELVTKAPAAAPEWEAPAVEVVPPPRTASGRWTAEGAAQSWSAVVEGIPEAAPAAPLAAEPAWEIDDEPLAVPDEIAPSSPVAAAPLPAFVPTPIAAPPPAPAPLSPPPSAVAVSEIAPTGLSAADVERIARRVIELLAPETVREVAWEVIPDLAEVVIKSRLRELESQLE